MPFPVELEKTSGKIILEHFDLLKEIYKGSTMTMPISSRPNTSLVHEE